MTLKSVRNAILRLSALMLACGIGYWIGQREIAVKWKNFRPEVTIVNKAVPPKHRDIDFSLFWDVWNNLENNYLDSSAINAEKMVYGAISGMTAALGDPYTVFLPPQQQTEAKADLAGTFDGVGIQLGYNKDNQLVVVAPLDGTPAQEAGILAKDQILHLKDDLKKIDRDTEGINLIEAVEIIRGPKNQPITLTLARPGKGQFEVTLKRDTILVKSVTLEFISGEDLKPPSDTSDTSDTSVAYVRLSRFGDRTNSEWNEAVEQIIKKSKSAKINGLVLDIRNNPGGYFDDAVTIAGEFFREGKLVEQKGKTDSKSFSVRHPGRLTEIPLVVLMNKGSASSSEIVAGAIRARERGRLVGENTFGKGTIQNAQELKEGAGLHVTVARWLLPDGNWINEQGLKPDVEVEYDSEISQDQKYDNQIQEAIRQLSNY